MDISESVSKGCFAFKGKKRVLQPVDVLPDKTARDGHKAGHKLWEEIRSEVQTASQTQSEQLFGELLQFLGSCHQRLLRGNSSSSSAATSTVSSSVGEVPAAALITGVNVPDHAALFQLLQEGVRGRVTPHVALLHARDCPSLKATLSHCLAQLLPPTSLEEEEEEEDEKKEMPQKSSSGKVRCSMSSLVDWYHLKYRSGKPSPKKRRSADGSGLPGGLEPPLVVILEDFEAFSPSVLQDFISVCSEYLAWLPLVLVLGVATALTTVHRLLPHAVSARLCLETFQAPPSSSFLTQVITKVLLSPQIPFKLGGRVFQTLLELFLFHDFSVISFVQRLKFCVMEHFQKLGASSLCCSPQECRHVLASLSHHGLELVRQLPSFMRFVESQPAAQRKRLIQDDMYCKTAIEEMLGAIHQYHQTLLPALSCLHILVSQLPTHPLGKQLREVYAASLEKSIVEQEAYSQVTDLLRMLSRESLAGMLRECVQLLQRSAGVASLDQTREALQSLLSRLDNLDNEPIEEEEEEEETEAVTLEKTNLHNLRKTLLEMERKKKKLSPFEKIRAEILDFFHEFFKQHLPCPQLLPLHEIFYFNSASSVQQQLHAAPRASLQLALSQPHTYLQCACCEADHDNILPSMPDICIAYKLHLECGQFINLYDWLQAFITVVTSQDKENESKEQKQVLQARFTRAVAELQHLGFIKPTRRKTDHVMRLTWGGC